MCFRTVSANGQTNIIGNASSTINTSLPVSLLPQAAELLKQRRLSDSSEVTPQEVEIYLNRGLVKREAPDDDDELVIPSTSVISSHKSSEILKECASGKTINDEVTSDNPESPLPIVVQVKQEQESPDLSPSSPTTNSSELPPASTVIQAYSSHVLTHGYESLAAQYTTTTVPQYQNQPTTSVYMVATPPDYRGLPDYYTEQIKHNLAAAVTNAVPAYTDATDTALFVDRYIRQAAGYKGIHGITVDLPSPDSGIGETAVNPRESSISQVSEVSFARIPLTAVALINLFGLPRNICMLSYRFGLAAEL